jgi:hypothetical protein
MYKRNYNDLIEPILHINERVKDNTKINNKVEQQHLSIKQQVNLGSYYTKPELVDIVYNLLQKHVNNFNKYTILDTSCGYGSFLNYDISNKKIGADIDKIALQNANINNSINHNSLLKIARKDYNLKQNEKLIIVGNPPYNDITSIVKNKIKQKSEIHKEIKTRDLGMSFLLSYHKLKADYICVLHPLSYLIKETNFNTLKDFTNNYKLIDGLIISSGEFSDCSNVTTFPIIIALYERGKMNYEFIKNCNFKTKEGANFKISNFTPIINFITKYPNQKIVKESDAVAKFYTMRDINALKRNQTFMNKTTYNTIFVTADKLHYYCYVDCFKKYAIDKLPYYLGNCDVFIDNEKFLKVKDSFIKEEKDIIKKYFEELLCSL